MQSQFSVKEIIIFRNNKIQKCSNFEIKISTNWNKAHTNKIQYVQFQNNVHTVEKPASLCAVKFPHLYEDLN